MSRNEKVLLIVMKPAWTTKTLILKNVGQQEGGWQVNEYPFSALDKARMK